jgi:hypothetical protein
MDKKSLNMKRKSKTHGFIQNLKNQEISREDSIRDYGLVFCMEGLLLSLKAKNHGL